mmetsp:Transcript_20856/g.28729  ORF Transcript_20856/g.28729 Transcript_20856/m.28729 type:complete len:229 (-) Transcript_20856:562-1248(-)
MRRTKNKMWMEATGCHYPTRCVPKIKPSKSGKSPFRMNVMRVCLRQTKIAGENQTCQQIPYLPRRRVGGGGGCARFPRSRPETGLGAALCSRRPRGAPQGASTSRAHQVPLGIVAHVGVKVEQLPRGGGCARDRLQAVLVEELLGPKGGLQVRDPRGLRVVLGEKHLVAPLWVPRLQELQHKDLLAIHLRDAHHVHLPRLAAHAGPAHRAGRARHRRVGLGEGVVGVL